MNPATDFRSGSDRRHSDPPNLWLAVLAGSLIVHLLLLLSGRLFLVRTPNQKSAGVAAPIELVDIPAKSSSQATQTTRSAAPKVITESTASQGAVSSETTSQSSAPIQPAVIPKTTQNPVRSAPQTPQAPPKPDPIKQPAPKPIREQKPNPQATVTPSPLASSQPSPSPIATPSPLASSQPNPSQPATPDPSESEKPPVSSGNPLSKPSVPGGAGSDSSAPNSKPQAPDQPLGSVAVGEQRGSGSGVQVALSNPQLGDDSRTVPDQPARPTALRQSMPEANYPSAIGLNFGQSVRLRVLVKNTGKLDPLAITVLEGSRSIEYDNLAIELVKQWAFDPALQAGKPVNSLLDISVRLDALR